jgi:hypothetical protein
VIAPAAALALVLLLTAAPAHADAPTRLHPVPGSMSRQHQAALQAGYRFYRTPSEVQRAEARGELVAMFGNADYETPRISFPVARPETQRFLERLAREYHTACGERLVVTSLTRAHVTQPGNAHDLSVHPAGLAVDLRVPPRAACRGALEELLLDYRSAGVIEAVKEFAPPHYHLALLPAPFQAWEEEQARLERVAAGSAAPEPAAVERAAEPRPGGLRGLLERLITLPGRILAALRA